MALAATLLAVFMMGCSDMGVDNSVASTSEIEDKGFLPYFVFKDDGSRLDENRAELKMNRKSLVLGANESFDDLKREYQKKLYDDNAFSRNMLRPANYYCDETLLAINTDYETVVSFSGDTLLSDYSFYKGCKPITGNNVSLKRQGEELPFYNAAVLSKTQNGVYYEAIAFTIWNSVRNSGSTTYSDQQSVVVRAYKQNLKGDIAPYVSDWIHIALASGLCRNNGTSLSCRDVYNDYVHYQYHFDVHYACPEKTRNSGEQLLTVANFAVVFNLGQPNQVILAGNVATDYSGMTRNMLLSFYRTYIYDVYANQ